MGINFVMQTAIAEAQSGIMRAGCRDIKMKAFIRADS